MTAAEQFERWGACVEPQDDVVILQVGKELVALQPDEARHFAYWLSHAYYHARLIAEAAPELPQGSESIMEAVS